MAEADDKFLRWLLEIQVNILDFWQEDRKTLAGQPDCRSKIVHQLYTAVSLYTPVMNIFSVHHDLQEKII